MGIWWVLDILKSSGSVLHLASDLIENRACIFFSIYFIYYRSLFLWVKPLIVTMPSSSNHTNFLELLTTGTSSLIWTMTHHLREFLKIILFFKSCQFLAKLLRLKFKMLDWHCLSRILFSRGYKTHGEMTILWNRANN